VIAKRSGVDVFFHSTITDATRDGGQVVSASVHDHNGTATVTASTWVDGSGECQCPPARCSKSCNSRTPG
jgi:hypothetical protein